MRYFVTLISILVASPALSDAVDSAYVLCSVIDGTGLSSAPCEVSGWSGTITATIDMNSSEARKLCPQIAQAMHDRGKRFSGRQWTLQIKSPYSGENTIAFCNLPQ
jgi:hypothetical protein